MPATYTHAIYGQMVLEQLDASTRALIKKHRDCYDIGLSGPDILFFYNPLSKNPVKALGHDMHNEPARNFFEQARQIIVTSEDSEAALVYILGFINHFVLDSQCHPCINQTVAKSTISHSELESELDAMLMREKGLDPVSTRVTEHICPTLKNQRIIAPFFKVTEKEIGVALHSMKRFLNLFVAPGNLKRGLIFAVMKLIKLYDGMHGLVFNREVNPNCQEVCEKLRRMIDEAVCVSCRLIQEYRETLHSSNPLDARYDRNYE